MLLSQTHSLKAFDHSHLGELDHLGDRDFQAVEAGGPLEPGGEVHSGVRFEGERPQR